MERRRKGYLFDEIDEGFSSSEYSKEEGKESLSISE